MISVKKQLKKQLKQLYIASQSADPSPPLGTILGNLGVNTVSFCTAFNLHTKTIPTYFLLKVKIEIYENRSTSFIVDAPSTGNLLSLLKFEKLLKVQVHDRVHTKPVSCIKLEEVLKLAKFKFPELKFEKSVRIILGSVKAMNLKILKFN